MKYRVIQIRENGADLGSMTLSAASVKRYMRAGFRLKLINGIAYLIK